MIIVGGTYREICRFPEKNDLFGSGLKAACALSSVLKKIELHTFLSKEDVATAQGLANTFKFKLDFIERPNPIGFSYYTPVSKPNIFGVTNSKIGNEISGKNVLCFGTIEGDSSIKAKKIVFDPQSPKNTKLDLEKLECEELAIVLNKHEARELSRVDDIKKSATIILKKYKAHTVVIKCGALGAYLATKNQKAWIGVYPSSSVYPIGSGDVFSAFFAAGWLEMKMSSVQAAKWASKAVSTWTQNPELFYLLNKKNIDGKKIELASTKKPTVYLGGPFFNLGQNWMVELAKAALENLGADVFSPVHDVGRGGDEVAKPDLDGLDKSTSMLALLDGLDTGTIFEIGYAIAKGINVVGFCENPKNVDLKMIRGSGVPIYTDFSTAIYQSIWAGTK